MTGTGPVAASSGIAPHRYYPLTAQRPTSVAARCHYRCPADTDDPFSYPSIRWPAPSAAGAGQRIFLTYSDRAPLSSAVPALAAAVLDAPGYKLLPTLADAPRPLQRYRLKPKFSLGRRLAQ
ncbi:hypothetical protein [Hymenobacter negativus]|uniref:Uncharacterized protein n=1 Tax=Hymenobacter negativus TaxID=2795026 RepID=A0ABS3QLE5_9BACT|nr:hypothetical protein [Hymenobacter negativus]MBO2011798.1 hypothetical protein [Hymenobacter negativus]